MIIKTDDPVGLAKEIFWLAWQACGGPLGMGVLQDRGGITKEDVWQNVSISGDYPVSRNKSDSPYADYVFGRMMKFGLKIADGCLDIPDRTSIVNSLESD